MAIRQAYAADPRRLAEARFALARALWDSGEDRRRAVVLTQSAVVGFAAAGRPARGDVAKGWLARHARP